jgi:hypothetical protein
MRARASTPSGTGTAAAAALAAVWIASLAGLLWIPLDLYDEPALALGARIVRSGGFPYVDFYTHYGPLGYGLMALFLELGNPGIAYRLAQGLALAVVAVPMVPLVRRLCPGRGTAAAVAAFGLLNISAAIVFTHFFAYALVLLSLELVALAELEPAASHSEALWIGAGAAVGLAGLVRPAFAAYALAAVVGFAFATREIGRLAPRLARFLGGAAGSAGLVWLLLYRDVPLADAWLASVIVPERLTGGKARFLSPALLPPRLGPTAQSLFGALHLAALFLLATFASIRARERRARAAAAVGALGAAATPFALRAAEQPGRVAAFAAVLLYAAALASFVFAARSLSESAASRVSALSGLAAVAFLHYYLTRADQAHVTAALALAVIAALAHPPRLSPAWRACAGGLLAVAIFPILTGAVPYPAYWFGRLSGGPSISTASGFWARFPASTFPAEAVAAVERADRGAAPGSRFVALATDHSRTEGSAVVLFLLSQRLPYTRWYAYDPGVQSVPLVQSRMLEELERSGSATAVTWRSESFAGAPEADPPRTALDRRFRELYPRVSERYGGLEVRERAAKSAGEAP